MPDQHDDHDLLDDELADDELATSPDDRDMFDDETSDPSADDVAVSTAGSDGALERVRALVAPLVRDLRLDLYDIEFRGGTLRVTIDTPPGSPGGVDLEAITLATRMISRDLDHADPIAGRYTLEVTSPGLERTLRTPTHFQREIGKTVALRLREVTAGERRLTGVLVAADAEAATVRLEGTSVGADAERRVPYQLIDRARTVFVWGPAPKPGKGPKQSKPAKPAKPATSPSVPSVPSVPTVPTSVTSPTESSPIESSQEAT